jgi:hypothetical protein
MDEFLGFGVGLFQNSFLGSIVSLALPILVLFVQNTSYILMASADNPGGWKLSSLLTRVLFRPSIPQVAAMKQKYVARSKIFV